MRRSNIFILMNAVVELVDEIVGAVLAEEAERARLTVVLTVVLLLVEEEVAWLAEEGGPGDTAERGMGVLGEV